MNTIIAESMRKYFTRWNILGSVTKVRFNGKKEKSAITSVIPKKFVSKNSFFTNVDTYKPPIRTVLTVTGIKFAHTDIKVPDFHKFREESTQDPNVKSKKSLNGRINKNTSVQFGSNILALYGTKALVWQYVAFLAASAEVMAMAKIEIKLQEIPEGKNAVFKWRGKPLFIKHRTPAEIETERSYPVSSLRDPETDEARCRDPKWLVIIGVCTHLGCIPVPNQGDFPGGYYCPCHGSHYDAAGRIRKGPAPLNMEIPDHVFIDSNTLLVG